MLNIVRVKLPWGGPEAWKHSRDQSQAVVFASFIFNLFGKYHSE